MGGEMMGGMGAMALWMLLCGLVGIAVLALTVVGIVSVTSTSLTTRLMRRSDGPRSMPPAPDLAEELLRRRYAAGEVDEDEYLRRRSGLSWR